MCMREMHIKFEQCACQAMPEEKSSKSSGSRKPRSDGQTSLSVFLKDMLLMNFRITGPSLGRVFTPFSLRACASCLLPKSLKPGRCAKSAIAEAKSRRRSQVHWAFSLRVLDVPAFLSSKMSSGMCG